LVSNSNAKKNDENLRISFWETILFKHVRVCLFFIWVLTSGLHVQVYADTLSVAVAANAQYVFEDLRTEFKKQTGHTANAVIGSSGQLLSQIVHGAPVDVFLSADTEYPQALFDQGFALEKSRVYAFGALVLWSMKDFDLQQWQKLLLDEKKIVKFAIANPKTAPFGREALHALTYYHLETSIQARLVLGESIAQTNQYIHSGVVEAGITAKSVVSAPAMRGQGHWIEIDPESYTPIAQAVVVVKQKDVEKMKIAKAFYDFLFSEKARAIFKQHGYKLP
jgi:molybdate transport system substrate-binding protein